MALILNVESLSKSYGARALFDDLSFCLFDGQRLGLIGPNGAGKSTLLKIIAGLDTPDAGVCAPRKGLRLGYVPQVANFGAARTVAEAARAAISDLPMDDHERDDIVARTLSRHGFTIPDRPIDALSGGWRKRLGIVSVLMREPDLLLMDEPTNHLDLEGILWLEEVIREAPWTTIVISHDRYFLEAVSTSVAELNPIYPRGCLRVDGSYADFLESKERFLAADAKEQASLANKVAREVEWLRRGPAARSTKQRARIQEAERLQETFADNKARLQTQSVSIDFSATQRKTKKLMEAEQVALRRGGRLLFEKLDLLLSPGTRLGLIGLNGSGKTSLLKLLSRELIPDAGRVSSVDGVRVVYFQQNRESLDPDATLRRALAPDGDGVIYRGRSVHVASWARRFAFRAEQLDTTVGRLSGGEQARVQIANLVRQEADVLLLDEPTNDLDIDTLETLEESLLDFPGAVVLVTHDRYMLDRVSTTILGLDGAGTATPFADVSQWRQFERARLAPEKKQKSEKPATPTNTNASAPTTNRASKKLSYLEQREWDSMEERIAAAERHLGECQSALEDPSITAHPQRLHEAYEAHKAAENEVERLFNRWAELDAKQR